MAEVRENCRFTNTHNDSAISSFLVFVLTENIFARGNRRRIAKRAQASFQNRFPSRALCTSQISNETLFLHPFPSLSPLSFSLAYFLVGVLSARVFPRIIFPQWKNHAMRRNKIIPINSFASTTRKLVCQILFRPQTSVAFLMVFFFFSSFFFKIAIFFLPSCLCLIYQHENYVHFCAFKL